MYFLSVPTILAADHMLLYATEAAAAEECCGCGAPLAPSRSSGPVMYVSDGGGRGGGGGGFTVGRIACATLACACVTASLAAEATALTFSAKSCQPAPSRGKRSTHAGTDPTPG